MALRGGLEALEHAALTLRGLARSVLDSTGIASEASPVRDRETRVQLASVLAKLGEAIRTYGRLVQLTPAGSESLESELAAELDGGAPAAGRARRPAQAAGPDRQAERVAAAR